MKKLIFTLLCLSLAASSYAATIIVDVNGGGDFETIQVAIDAAVNGDVVVLQPGTFIGYGNRDIDFKGKAITVRGATGDPNEVIIDCQGTSADRHRGFKFISGEDANSILESLTITNGYGPHDEMYGSSTIASIGGAVYCFNTAPTIINCIIGNNTVAYHGSGLYGSNGIVKKCIISGNSAEYNGGGLAFCDGTIEKCTISGNSAGDGSTIFFGGGLFECDGTIIKCNINNNSAYGGGGLSKCDGTIQDCDINNNSASASGGGLQNCNGTIKNCNIHSNSADSHGGGLSYCRGTILHCEITDNLGGGIDSCDGIIRNCIIRNNSALNGGGFVFCDATIENCTIYNNSAGYGGGLYACEGLIKNCIIWSNTSYSYNHQIYGYTIPAYCCIQDWSGGGIGNISDDPCFVAPDVNDFHLLTDSLCIDAGDPNYIAEPNETDLDGRPRVLFGRIDMGAYEFNNIPIADAGPNQTAYAWIDGFAEVILDGNDSWDPDGNELTYLWSWTIDGNLYDTNGVNPIIELPIGTNNIELIVNDGIDDSEPNETTVTVIEPLEVSMHFTPRVLNPKSKGKWVKAHFILPEGFTAEDVNTNSPAKIVEPFMAESVYMDVFLNEDGLVKIMAAFDRAVFCSNGSMLEDIVVIAQLTTGQYFYGTDTIRIKTNNLEYLAVLTSYWLEAGCGEPDWCEGSDINQDGTVDFIDFAFFDGCCLEFIQN